MKIVEINRDAKGLPIPTNFTVGVSSIENVYIVTEILYCRDGYSAGSKGKWPAYVVKFSDTRQVRVIPETEVVDMIILPDEPTKDKKPVVNPEAAIPLPEA
jgi:hypothetical protein